MLRCAGAHSTLVIRSWKTLPSCIWSSFPQLFSSSSSTLVLPQVSLISIQCALNSLPQSIQDGVASISVTCVQMSPATGIQMIEKLALVSSLIMTLHGNETTGFSWKTMPLGQYRVLTLGKQSLCKWSF